MREACRVCGRELCGNQRRWIFHTAARLSLQVLLAHVLGREVPRDGRAEFACSKCAFMLERVYRFDTVIARIEALSIERLQKLLLEKERLKLCLAGMYRKNNAGDGDGAADAAGLPDARYSALLQEDFAYSGFECWAEPEERALEPPPCHDGAGGRPRRCRGCAGLRVADADYEAICRIPRKVARGGPCAPASQCSASLCAEETPASEPVSADLPSSGKAPLEEESMEEETPGSSLESLDAAAPAGPSPQEEDAGTRRGAKCECGAAARGSALRGSRLDFALSLVRALDCKPVQSPRGSKLPVPVRASLLGQDLVDRNAYAGVPGAAGKSHSAPSLAFPLEMSDLQHLWEDLAADYMPLRVQNLREDPQHLAQCDLSLRKQATELNATELLEKIRCMDSTNQQLQEKLSEMNCELRSVQHTSQKQDHKIQNLNESLKSKEKESEELYRVIEGQNETIAKLQDELHKSQLGQLQISEGSSALQQKQQTGLLDAQNRLFCAQLEVQQLKRVQQQKARQLAESERTAQFLETVLQEEQQQKEAAWQHNQELRAALQQRRAELQSKHWQCCTLESEKWAEAQRQERKLKHVSHSLACKEQLLQESSELLQYHQSLDGSPVLADKMVQKLQQRIKDRDAALERAVDEKFRVLEDREQELQELRLSLKEREHDLNGLRRVLSSNQATIQGLEGLLKARGLELEQLLAACQSLKRLKEETEAKSRRWQAEQESIVRQLRTAVCGRHEELEVLSETLLCKLGHGQKAVVEELCLRLHQKEQVIQGLLRDKSWQAAEQAAELQELLQAASSREQQSNISSAKLAQALTERSCELQVLRQQLTDQASQQKTEASAAQLVQDDEAIEALKQECSGKNIASLIPAKGESGSTMEKGVLETAAGLEKELLNAKEELDLLTQKERESRLELAALRSVVTSQEEELQVQASDIESLTRSVQVKEGLIKDLQMQLVDPEEMPAVERLTQEVLMLQEKVAGVELQGQGATGNRRLQLLLALEGLAAERHQLNKALKAEAQLYHSLGKCHAQPGSSQQEQTLHLELEEVQELRRQLEEALGRTLERLSRLESLEGVGGLSAAEDEDASTEFTDSIEEEAQQVTPTQQSVHRGPDGSSVGQARCPDSPPVGRENSLQAELLSAKSEIQQVREQKTTLEGELQAIKGQVEEAGFASVAQLRKALLSLCLENAELKEQVGEATLSEGWENDEQKEEEEDLRREVRKLQEKLRTSEVVIGLLKGQLVLNSHGREGIFSQQLQMAKRYPGQGHHHDSAPQWHCPPPQGVDSSPSHNPKGTQTDLSLTASPPGGRSGHTGGAWQRCRKLCDQLLGAETTSQAPTAPLDPSQALRREPTVQQDSKQIQVDLQDLGYETCGRSENEADREEATSPECESHDVELKTWKKLLGLPPCGWLDRDCSRCCDTAALHQHIQALPAQLRRSPSIIQALQGHVCSRSTASDCASRDEFPLQLKWAGALLGSSPSQNLTDEDEGWHSDSLGSLRPPSRQPSKDLAELIQRVSQLEAHLGEAKPKLQRPEALQPAASMGKYDSLVQAQARELSHLRQVMREGQGACRMLSQYFRGTVKSFEELLRGNDVDCFLGQSFRDQLAQGSQLAGWLARKLSAREFTRGSQSSRNELNTESKSSHELLVLRLSQELQEKERIIQTLQAKEACSVTPCSSRAESESPRAGSSASFLSEGLESCSDADDASEDICPEDPGEGWLRSFPDKDLGPHSDNAAAPPPLPAAAATSPAAAPAESLRGSLARSPPQHPVQIASQAATGFPPGSLSEPAGFPGAPLASEPCSFMPSGPPLPAFDPLLGCCRTPVFSLAEAQQELQMLQKQLGESVRLPSLPPSKAGPLAGFLSGGSPAVSSERCLQACHPAPQLMPLQDSAAWKTTVGGHVGDSRTPRHLPLPRQPQEQLAPGGRPPPPCSSAVLSSQKLSGTAFLEEHLSEIRILRRRLQESICTNDRLREQMEARLALSASSSEHLQKSPLGHAELHRGKAELGQRRAVRPQLPRGVQDKRRDLVQLQEELWALQRDNSRLQHRVTLLQQQCKENQLLFQALEAELRVREGLRGPWQQAASGALAQEDPVLADDGSRWRALVTGHLKDYSNLQKQIREGKTLVHKMASLLQPCLEPQGSKVLYQESTRQLLADTCSLHRTLETSASLLATFWRGALPASHAQEKAAKAEMQVLKAKVAEQENRLQSAGQVKKSMENFLLAHLTRTHDVLKKARTNLEGMSRPPALLSSIV